MTEGVYDDLPKFSWDAGFCVDKFKQDIDMYNEELDSGVLEHLEHLYDRNWHGMLRPSRPVRMCFNLPQSANSVT